MVPVKKCVLHDVVRSQLAARRDGNASVKRRSDVVGSTHKLYRQKGTGRARRGDIKSPLLRGGGVIFGPSPRSYEQRLPKKVKRLALKMALSSKLNQNQLIVLDQVELPGIKTKAFAQIMNLLKIDSGLMIIPQADEIVEKSSRNLPRVKVLRTDGLNVYDILKYRQLVLVEASIPGIEGRLGK